MIVNNSLDEVKKRENALSIIKDIVENKGREFLFDLTGLSGGFIASPSELSLLETYVGPAIFEDALQEVGIEHYFETDVFDEFTIPDNTSLVIVTGSTMDHKVIDEDEFKAVIEMAHERNIPVMVDDASGARLRTVVFNQPKACDLGADIAITSTDKLMPGPRGGLMAGSRDLIDEIKVKVNQFGLEAQPPAVLAMVNGIKNFNKDNLVNSFERKDQLFDLLKEKFNHIQKTPTGVMITPEDLTKEIDIDHDLSDNDLAFVFSMLLLRNHGIITIPAVGMPGASATIRFDLSTSDAFNLDLDDLSEKIFSSFDELISAIPNEDECKKIIF